MTKKYELVCIFDPQVDDSGYETLVEKYEERLKANGAEIVTIDRWGLRKLAYTSVGFKRRQQGYFVLYQYTSETVAMDELKQEMKMDESVLRHLLTTVKGEFLRVPQLAPENVFIFTREDRGPRFGRGRRDRDGDSRDDRRGPAPATSHAEGGVAPPEKATADPPEEQATVEAGAEGPQEGTEGVAE